MVLLSMFLLYINNVCNYLFIRFYIYIKTRQSLGSTMRKVQFLTLFHFIFGVLYAIGLMIVSEITEFVVLFFVFPLSATMTIFYVWTLAALTNSINKLEQSK